MIKGGKVMLPVTFLNPLPANDALVSVAAAPDDGFFTPAMYRGAFAANQNWLCGWTASEAFGFTAPAATTPGPGQPGVSGAALMDINCAHNANCSPVGTPTDPNGPFFRTAESGTNMLFTFDGEPNKAIILFSGAALNPGILNLTISKIDVGTLLPAPPFLDVTIVADGTQPDFINQVFNTGPAGVVNMSFPTPFAPGTVFNFQSIILNSVTTLRSSNAVQVLVN